MQATERSRQALGLSSFSEAIGRKGNSHARGKSNLEASAARGKRNLQATEIFRRALGLK